MRQSVRVAMAMLVVLAMSVAARAQEEKDKQPQQPPANQGFLGGKFVPVEGQFAEQLGLDEQDGVALVEVVPDSPAEKAGLKEKDVLKKIDGKEIEDVDAFRAAMRGTKPGQTLKLTILRDKETKEISVTLGERPKNMPTTAPTTKP
jgi:serine protease Do